jgi:hypothetical protein
LNSFYTIIKLSPNPVSSDQISIGILLRSDSKFYLKFSERKINTVRKLLQGDFNLVKYFIKELEKEVDKANKILTEESNVLFNYDSILTSEFFLHLNRISQNLILFSEPSRIEGIDSEEKFNNLFNLFIDNQSAISYKSPKSEALVKNVEEKLINRVKDKVHTRINIDKRIIPSLNFTLNIDAIGLNGDIISAKSLDFNKEYRTIETILYRYKIVLSKIEEKYSKRKEAFIIADEPESKNSENYNIWEILHKESFKVYPSEDAGKVAEYIEEKNVRKFIETPH